MVSRRTVKEAAEGFLGKCYSKLPFPGIKRPVFIVGCGRSGTTILGQCLSFHGKITYLNEPRRIWSSVFPETDIWSEEARSRMGRLELTENDADPAKGKMLSRLFRFETMVSGRPLLVEKLPINNFRLRFINAIFPDARYVHIYRNGLEVAKSIALMVERRDWFGAGLYKWHELVEYAMEADDTKDLPGLCENDEHKGLLEWRLSTEAVVAFLRGLPEDRFLEIDYDTFVDEPLDAVSRIFQFIGVDGSSKIDQLVLDRVVRKSRKLDRPVTSEKERLLGGRLLALSMEKGAGIVGRL